MTIRSKDAQIVRDLAEQYAEVSAKPIQEERRQLWADHMSLKPTRPLVLATFGMWNVWCREVFADTQMRCQDPFYREHERRLRMLLFQDTVGDDFILEPWLTQMATVKGVWRQLWGVNEDHTPAGVEGGAWKFEPPIKTWDDLEKIRPTPHEVDEDATARNVSKLHDAVGGILPIDVPRSPAYAGFMADISTSLAGLRGLEQIFLDMYESPDELHRLLAFMCDGILANNAAAEKAGHFSLTSGINQAMTYARELERPCPNSGPRKRSQLWGFCAAQEFTLVSPEFHDEFLVRYQLPIYEPFGLLHYGCCENLTSKIDMLRQFKNLRSIAVTPTADVRACAEQIGRNYVISWRPNPTDMVCAGWDEGRIRRIVGDGLKACQGGFVHLHLKDVETVQGEPDRLARWVRIVRDLAG